MENSISEETTNYLIKKVLEKKELSSIDKNIVEKELLKVFQINPKLLKNVIESKNLEKNSSAKKIVKLVRSKLRVLSSAFTSSAEERKGHIKEVYKKIFSLIGRPKSVLDIGCGLNPLSFPLKNLKPIEYYACDIDKNIIKKVTEYLIKNKIAGATFVYDIRDIKENYLPNVDLCLLFKVFDAVEKKGHKLAEKIIKTVDCKFIVVSFATKTLSGKPMNHPKRGWIERMLTRIKLKWQRFETENEIFYVIEKKIQ